MIKVSVSVSEFRPLWRALRSRGVKMTRDPGIASILHSPANTSPLGYLSSILKGRLPRATETLNVPRGYKNPLGTFLHEAGHGMDPGYMNHIGGPRAQLTDEVIANRNVQRALSPASYEKIRPSLQRSFKTYGISTPLLAARRSSNASDGLWAAAVERAKSLTNREEFTKSIRRQMARRSPEFKAQFKDQAFNLQDLLKQRP